MRNKTIINEIQEKKTKRKLTMLCVYLEKLNLNMLKNLFNNKKKEKCNLGLVLKRYIKTQL